MVRFSELCPVANKKNKAGVIFALYSLQILPALAVQLASQVNLVSTGPLAVKRELLGRSVFIFQQKIHQVS